MSFKTLFNNCIDHDVFLSCTQKRCLPISFFPLHEIDFYLDLPSYLYQYLLILDIFPSHSKVIFKTPNNFFYESLNASEYKTLLKSSPIYADLNFGDAFSDIWKNKSGYIALQGKKFVLIEQLPYKIKSNFMLFKTYRVNFLLTLDKLSMKKIALLETVYDQIQSLVAPQGVSANKGTVAPNAKVARNAKVASNAKVAPNSEISPTAQKLPDVLPRGHSSDHKKAKTRSRRSVWDYLFGISANEVESEMNSHFE